jgi:hypothetical protein
VGRWPGWLAAVTGGCVVAVVLSQFNRQVGQTVLALAFVGASVVFDRLQAQPGGVRRHPDTRVYPPMRFEAARLVPAQRPTGGLLAHSLPADGTVAYAWTPLYPLSSAARRRFMAQLVDHLELSDAELRRPSGAYPLASATAISEFKASAGTGSWVSSQTGLVGQHGELRLLVAPGRQAESVYVYAWGSSDPIASLGEILTDWHTLVDTSLGRAASYVPGTSMA